MDSILRPSETLESLSTASQVSSLPDSLVSGAQIVDFTRYSDFAPQFTGPNANPFELPKTPFKKIVRKLN